MATVPVLVALGLVRAVALLRRGTGASWRDAIGAFFIGQSTSLVVARASVLGLFARKAAFLRTPKTSEKAKWWEALRANWAESSLALLGAAAIGRRPAGRAAKRQALPSTRRSTGRCVRAAASSTAASSSPRSSSAAATSTTSGSPSAAARLITSLT